MRILFLPFYSQQDKRAAVFLTRSDGGVKQLKYMCARCVELGHKCAFAVPQKLQCDVDVQLPHGVERVRLPLQPMDNLRRKVHWDSGWCAHTAASFDAVFSYHDTMAVPLTVLNPELLVYTECGMLPGTAWPQDVALTQLAWRSSAVVHCPSATIAAAVAAAGARSAVWTFGYDDALLGTDGAGKDVDILFPARFSATGYSGAAALPSAVRRAGNLVIVSPDPTSYARATMPEEELRLLGVPINPLTQQAYYDLLRRSRIVLGLTDNGYGGYAFMEACAAGALPVAKECSGYRELLGRCWPYCSQDISEALSAALRDGWDGVSEEARAEYTARLDARKYSVAWAQARKDTGL